MPPRMKGEGLLRNSKQKIAVTGLTDEPKPYLVGQLCAGESGHI